MQRSDVSEQFAEKAGDKCGLARQSVTAAAAARGNSGAARTLTRIINVMQVTCRNRISIKAHDRICEVSAFVRFDPGLDCATGN